MFRWPVNLGIAAALAAGALFAQQTPHFSANVNLVRVIATVKNQAGELVGSLEKGDFQILDRGVPQEISVFERRTAQPLSVALLIDISGSAAKDLKYEADSASRFLKTLLKEGNPEDRVALYSFNYQVTREHNFTHNYAALERSFRSMHADAGTALFDAIYLASKDLEDREGRKAIIVVTDGDDTTHSEMRRSLDAAQFADAVIYPIVVVPITNDAGRNIGGEHTLEFMAQNTGGKAFMPTDGAGLDQAFTEIINELRTEYLLGFYPRNVPLNKDAFHQLEVRVNRPGLRVSARNGYYGETEAVAGTPDARTWVTSGETRKR